MGFHVTLLDRDINKLREADKVFGTKVRAIMSNAFELEKAVLEADLVIGAVLIPGAKAPKLVTNELVSRMKPGSVLVDIAIDQGGCFEDSRPTTHAEPTFPVHNSVFYCVANMPGAVPNTSTYALTNATLPYIVELANRGWVEALRRDPRSPRASTPMTARSFTARSPRRTGWSTSSWTRCSAATTGSVDPVGTTGKRRYVNTRRQHRAYGRTLRDKVRPDVCRSLCRRDSAQLASNVTLEPFRTPVKPAVRRRTPLTEGCSLPTHRAGSGGLCCCGPPTRHRVANRRHGATLTYREISWSPRR
jgi:hypothetical protein